MITVIPNAEYLKEIRAITAAKEYKNDDTISLIEENCEVVERVNVKETHVLDSYLAENFLKMTPLTFSKQILESDIQKLKEITIDLEIIVCKK